MRQVLRDRGVARFFPKRNTEHGSGLGKHRWVVEVALAWVFQNRRLGIRYEKRDDIHDVFLKIGCMLICRRRINEWGFC
ncbi:MAG: hypothetical protein IID36_12745 [Planctomycetes bacterium]|nr:hypothetical protein [Planctomycetota bacterium]